MTERKQLESVLPTILIDTQEGETEQTQSTTGTTNTSIEDLTNGEQSEDLEDSHEEEGEVPTNDEDVVKREMQKILAECPDNTTASDHSDTEEELEEIRLLKEELGFEIKKKRIPGQTTVQETVS